MELIEKVAAAMFESPHPDDVEGTANSWPPNHPDDRAWWINLATVAVEAGQIKRSDAQEAMSTLNAIWRMPDRREVVPIEDTRQRHAFIQGYASALSDVRARFPLSTGMHRDRP